MKGSNKVSLPPHHSVIAVLNRRLVIASSMETPKTLSLGRLFDTPIPSVNDQEKDPCGDLRIAEKSASRCLLVNPGRGDSERRGTWEAWGSPNGETLLSPLPGWRQLCLWLRVGAGI